MRRLVVAVVPSLIFQATTVQYFFNQVAVNSAGTALYVAAYVYNVPGVSGGLLAISLVHPNTSSLVFTSSPNVAFGVALSPDSTVAYISTFNVGSYVYAFNLTSNTTIRAIYNNSLAGGYVQAVTVNSANTIAYIIQADANIRGSRTFHLYAVNIAAGTSGTPTQLYSTTSDIYYVALNSAATLAFLTSQSGVVVFNTTSGSSTILSPYAYSTGCCGGVALNPAETTAYVTSQGYVLAFNISASSVASVTLSNAGVFAGVALNAGGTVAYAAGNGGSVAFVYSLNLVGPFSSSSALPTAAVRSSAGSSSVMRSSSASSSAASSSVSSSMASSSRSVSSSTTSSSSTSATALTSSSVLNSGISGGSVVGDPQFSGLRGQSFQVHGTPNSYYALISTAHLHINAHFTLLTQGTCTVEVKARTACYAHAGNYFGAVTVLWKEGAGVTQRVALEWMESGMVGMDKARMAGAVPVKVEEYSNRRVNSSTSGEIRLLEVLAGDVSAGLRVKVAGVELTPSTTWRGLPTISSSEPPTQSPSSSSSVFVLYPDSSHLVVLTSEFVMRVDNSDRFLNVQVAMTPLLTQRVMAVTETERERDEAGEGMSGEAEKTMPHGLLGQTWSGRRYQSRLKVVEGEVEDYRVQEGTDTYFPFTRFA